MRITRERGEVEKDPNIKGRGAGVDFLRVLYKLMMIFPGKGEGGLSPGIQFLTDDTYIFAGEREKKVPPMIR